MLPALFSTHHCSRFEHVALDDRSLGQNIAAARERLGITQAQLALDSGIRRPTLSKLETGQQRISATNLITLANALGMRVEWLMTPPPQSIVSHRRHSRGAAHRIDREIEVVAREVEFLAEEDEDLAKTLALLPQRPFPQDDTQVEALAADARKLLGVEEEGPLWDIGQAMAATGVMVFSIDLGEDEADAATVLLEAGAVCVINAHMRTGRRRLSAAHELGHALLADEYTVDFHLGSSTNGTDYQEKTIDQFARALLLPQGSVADRWKELSRHPLHEAAVRMTSEFRVDMSTLARRLTDLGMIDPGQAQEVRETRTSRSDIVNFGLVVAEELKVGFFPDRYREAVERLYITEQLSTERALELLRQTCTAGDLPERPLRPEHDIWQFI